MPSHWFDGFDHELFRFVGRDDLGGVKLMLGVGANIDGSDDLPCRPLMKAVCEGYVDMVKFLIDRGADLEAAMRPEDGRTNVEGGRALHLAFHFECLECARVLVEAGANVNAVDGNTGFTPLVYACHLKQKEKCVAFVRMLLEAGADPAVPTNRGCVALHYVAAEGHIEAMDMILMRAPETLYHMDESGATPVSSAAKSGRVCAMEFLLSAEAKIEYPDHDLEPNNDGVVKHPLVVAAAAGQAETVQALLTRWMDDYDWDFILFLAIEIAAFHGRARILRIMFDAYEEKFRDDKEFWEQFVGATPEEASDDEDDDDLDKCPFDLDEQLSPSTLCSAVEGGHLAAVGVLLAAGVNETVASTRGRAAIDLVVGSARIGGHHHEEQKDRDAHEAHIKRMLLRGPAFRALSWTWPTTVAIPTSTTHLSDEGDTREPKKEAALCVRIFRPEKNDRKKAFVKALDRYALASF
ncbi:unnamed protein product [Ascophyllum nodosum]